MEEAGLNVIKLKSEILFALLQSQVSNSIIGINAKCLGPGTYMTAVVDIVMGTDDEPIVILKGYDMGGYFFDKASVSLDEIESVIPSTALFGNPFLRNIEREPPTIHP
jgi:hypothetical protein